MSNQNVVYTLSLKDQLTSGLNNADNAAQKLEGTMSSINKVGKLLGIIGGATALIGFGKSAVSAFNESAQATAQLEAGLRSTHNAVGLTSQAMQDQAKALQSMTTYDDDAIVGMQSLLLTFTNVKDKIFTEATPAILDLATRMGGDLNGAALQVGKALQDPITGMTALRRSGVSFSDAQQKVIKNLVETNQLGKAQTMILAELNNEFGGSAVAAAQSGTGAWQQLSNAYGDVMEDVGGLIVSMGNGLLPIIRGTISALGSLVSWIKENSDMIKQLAMVVGVATIAWGTYLLATNAVTIATKVYTATQWLLNAAMTANPIGLLITGLATLAAGVIYAYNKSETFRAGLWGVWGALKAVGESIRMYFSGLGEIITGVFTFDADKITSGVKNMADAMFGAGGRIAKGATEGYQAGLKDFAKSKQKTTTEPNGVATPTTGLGASPEAMASATPSKSKSVAQGTKVTTINVSIKDLIGEYNMNVTNVKEGGEKIKQIVVDTLMGAVNDFQLIVQ